MMKLEINRQKWIQRNNKVWHAQLTCSPKKHLVFIHRTWNGSRLVPQHHCTVTQRIRFKCSLRQRAWSWWKINRKPIISTKAQTSWSSINQISKINRIMSRNPRAPLETKRAPPMSNQSLRQCWSKPRIKKRRVWLAWLVRWIKMRSTCPKYQRKPIWFTIATPAKFF